MIDKGGIRSGLRGHDRSLTDLNGNGLADIPTPAQQRMLREPSLSPAALYRYAGRMQWRCWLVCR
ncbi:hypothetical protein [Pseudomonas paeninsulae]|uniref:hypothetical protein n=1 Tax=Pseudomonas paeninsulae TaxID=3110772 RepID=UPI002D76667D|nr:hypothetical protein [Pseudomonas sp. IT1137]